MMDPNPLYYLRYSRNAKNLQIPRKRPTTFNPVTAFKKIVASASTRRLPLYDLACRLFTDGVISLNKSPNRCRHDFKFYAAELINEAGTSLGLFEGKSLPETFREHPRTPAEELPPKYFEYPGALWLKKIVYHSGDGREKQHKLNRMIIEYEFNHLTFDTRKELMENCSWNPDRLQQRRQSPEQFLQSACDTILEDFEDKNINQLFAVTPEELRRLLKTKVGNQRLQLPDFPWLRAF